MRPRDPQLTLLTQAQVEGISPKVEPVIQCLKAFWFDPISDELAAEAIERLAWMHPVVVSERRLKNNQRFHVVSGFRTWGLVQHHGIDPFPAVVLPTRNSKVHLQWAIAEVIGGTGLFAARDSGQSWLRLWERCRQEHPELASAIAPGIIGDQDVSEIVGVTVRHIKALRAELTARTPTKNRQQEDESDVSDDA